MALNLNPLARSVIISILLLAPVGCTTAPQPSATPTPPTVAPTTISPLITPTQPPITPAALAVDLRLIAQGLTAPVDMVTPDDGTGRIFVAEQTGVIKVVMADGRVLPEPWLDLHSQLVELRARYDERGLLGLALHPQFKKNGRLFVYYTAPLRPGALEAWDHTNRVAEFTVSPADPNRADAGSERVILEIDQPYYSHDGGQLRFGPDGYLYIATGDGGPGGDPNHHAQSLDSLLGKILRIDVDGEAPYHIPPDNPFVGGTARGEIFALGFRQPYRFSFDQSMLIVADVGHDRWEEINVVAPGGNYGWNIREGRECFKPNDPAELFSQCADVDAGGHPLLDPVLQYNRANGRAIIGGFVYRGRALPELTGRYVFGDWRAPSGTLSLADMASDADWRMAALTLDNDTLYNNYLLGIGEDVEGELYILTSDRASPGGSGGALFKLVPESR